MPQGSIGSRLAFNITHADPKLRAVYGDLRFRQAVSHAINRDEMNEVLYFGLGTPSQALPANAVVRDAGERELHDRLRSRQGERAARRDGDEARRATASAPSRTARPFTILWEYSSQFASPEFVKLMTDYLNAVGLAVNAKELTSEATRENAKAGGRTSTWSGTCPTSRR